MTMNQLLKAYEVAEALKRKAPKWHIRVSWETRSALKALKRRDESYEAVIKRLIKEAEGR